jgi:hypothetical protein
VDPATFWSLIDSTRFVSDGDPHRHAETLKLRLEKLPREDIVAFETLWREYDAAAYGWQLRAAAYLLNGGCDDRCFDNFRAYVIGLGEDVYRAALEDADTLVFLARGPSYQFANDAEGLAFAAEDAYVSVTGEEMPPDIGPDLPDEPWGEKWDEATPEVAAPKIAAAVGWLEA